jgi:hypothetical protein
MKAIPPQEITLGQFTLVFISWGLLAVGALIWPEFTEALDLNRTRATIWVTSILLIPAVALYPFRSASQCTANLAHLFWTFAYLMFLLHAYWAIFVIFDGVRDTFAQMGIIIAGMNFLLLGWWGLDVVLLWTVPSESNRMHRFQRATRVFTFLVFALTLIVLRGGPARVLGGVFVGVVALALAVRFWARDNYARPLVRP